MIVVLAAGVAAVLTLAMALGMIGLDQSGFSARVGLRASAQPVRRTGPRLQAQLESLGVKVGRGVLDTARRSIVSGRLVHAGFYAPTAPEVFFGVRALTAVGLALGGLLVCFLMHVSSFLHIAAVVMAGAALGLYGPNIWLSRRIASRDRALLNALPDALDLMVVCTEAGGAIGAALQRVEMEFRDLHPVLSEHLSIVLTEMQAGASRAETLQRFAMRAPLDEVRKLVALIIQSDVLGASISQTMRVFAQEMRDNRYLDAERRAAELPVKMAIPLVLFIFPALATVIFTPILIRFIRILFKLG